MKLRSIGCALGFAVMASAAWAGGYEKSIVVSGISGAAPGITPHGISGLNFGKDGKLYAGSVIGPGVYRVDVKTGAVDEVVAGMVGESDDVAMGPDGTLVWTAILSGELRAKRPNGTIDVIAKSLPMINPVNFTSEGRLFTGQIAKPDTLIEIDITGKKPPRTVASDMGGINAFVDDGLRGEKAGLYVPLADKGAVGRIDLATGNLRIVADGLGQPVSVKRDSHGGLVTLDWTTGRVSHVNAESGETQRITTVPPPLDNLAIGPDDTIYVSRPTDNSIIAVHPATGKQTPIVQGKLSAPGGLALMQRDGKPALIVSDAYGYRYADLQTGDVELLPFDLAANASTAVAVTAKHIILSYVRRPSVTVIDRASGRVSKALSGFNVPMGVAANDSGDIFVADYGSGEILQLMPGATPDRKVVASGLQGPVGLALDQTGHLYVSEAASGTISRIEIATQSKDVLVEGLSQPEGLALLPGGKIAVAEVGARRLSVVEATKASRVVVADNLAVGAVFTRAPAPVYLPTGVAADERGAIYITCDGDNTVLKFTPTSP